MSHDVYLTVDTGDRETVVICSDNYTGNVSGMWADALGHPLADRDTSARTNVIRGSVG